MNRNEYDVDGPQMSVPSNRGMRYFDLYHGVELKPDHEEGDVTFLSFPIEAHGFGAVLATNGEPDATMQQLMAKMKAMTAKPLSSYSIAVEDAAAADRRRSPPTKPASSCAGGMVKIPGGRLSSSRSAASRSKDATISASTCNIRGKIAAPLPRAQDAHSSLLHR